jgi:hypothetical protein
MIGFRSTVVAVFALGSALTLGGVGVARAQAQTQPQTQTQTQTRPQTQTQTRPQVPAQAPATPTAGLASPLAVHSLDRLSATRERPLFSPSRRAPAPPAPPPPRPPPPPPEPPNVTLVGIVMNAEEARAIVQSGPKNEVRRVRVGDDIGGWKVAQIENRRLVLKLDSRQATFSMFSGNRKPAPRAAAQPAARAAAPRAAAQAAPRAAVQAAPRAAQAAPRAAPQPAPEAADNQGQASPPSLVPASAPTQGSPGRRGHDD